MTAECLEGYEVLLGISMYVRAMDFRTFGDGSGLSLHSVPRKVVEVVKYVH